MSTIQETRDSLAESHGSAPAAVLAAELQDCFGVEFVVCDRVAARILCDALHVNAQLAAEFAQQRHVSNSIEVFEQHVPLIVLSIPVHLPDDTDALAIGLFTSAVLPDANLLPAAELLGMSVADTEAWIGRQPIWTADAISRLAHVFLMKKGGDQERFRLENELAKAADNRKELYREVSRTYEELTLLYRITESLNRGSNVENLPDVVVNWLFSVVPARGIAIYFTASPAHTHGRASEQLLTWGDCPLNRAEFARMIEVLDLKPQGEPSAFNSETTTLDAWSFPSVQELLIAPLTTNKHCFGWIAAFNHAQTGWYGTVEAGLLNAVASILSLRHDNVELYRRQRESLATVDKSKQALAQLQTRLDQLSEKLCSTYEEIHLLHQVAQNLSLITEFPEFLDLVLTHLRYVLSAEGVAFHAAARPADVRALCAIPHVVSSGRVPINSAEFSELLHGFVSPAGPGPVVVNGTMTPDPWPFQAIHGVAAAPVRVGDDTFGWIVAVNPTEQPEFGTIEGNLVFSVAGIVATHPCLTQR